MSLKDLFKEDGNLKSPEPLTKQDIDNQIESFDFMAAVRERNHRFLPLEEFANPKAFARFGSAEKYYEDSISRIYDTYPYDGSLKEKALWELSSSYLDLYIFENGYPRTTGYITLTTSSLTATDMYSGYGAAGTSSYEYILIKGGPNPGTGKSLYYDYQQDKTVFRKDANIYDLAKNRENNLKIGGTDGNTVEFWLKKTAFDNSATEKEVILDVFATGTLSSSADYARLRIEMTGAASGSPFLVTYMSGTTGFAQASIGSSITAATVADDAWHHYAFRFKNTGSNVVSDLFIDGDHNHRVIGGTAVSYVSGALVATLGALGQSPSGNVYIDGPDRGYAKLSGSLDEFRYWKTFRTSEKIQRYWFGQVGAGTNSDPANTDLGVYYKFNEGITQTASVDSSVLDFSGRISNGAWTGYSTLYSRNTGSAIISSSASPMEFEDPIIYSFQPNVSAFKTQKKLEGRIHDDTNGNGLDSYLPQWMLQANETDFENLDQNQLLNALQIIGSYFDSAAILMDKLPALKHEKYYTSGSFAPPFNKRFLESKGFIVPDIFIDAGLLNQFEDRDDNLKYEHTLQEIKNTIYQNIYNNLTYINKSKGTEKAFRNLLRCFGIGDNVLKFNIYANNTAYQLEDNMKLAVKTKNYVNFNEIDNGDATVYQYRTDSNATSYISGTKDSSGGYEGSGLGFTLEGDFILPNRVGIMEYATLKPGLSSSYSNLYPLIVSSSLFGLHTANGTENDLTWDTNDYANFQVYTSKDDKYSSTAKFVLTGTIGGAVPLLSSSYFEDVYDDDRWSISVSLKPKQYPQVNQPSGSGAEGYIVQFYGCSYIGDIKHKSFLVTGSMTTDQGRNFLSSHKRVYTGAHRTNFTGALLQFADTKATEVKAWYMPLDTAAIDQHNMKVDNYGASSPTKNAFLYQNAINRIEIPEIDTLALRWNFNAVSSSNAAGQFAVEDASSGSATAAGQGWFSGVVGRRHTASGSFFAISSANAVQKLERGTLQQQVPEVLLDSNLVNIIENQSDDFYTRGSRPITYNLSIEKNLFQDISEDMLNMFASVGYFNTLLGTNVNRYRGQYKELIKAGNQYFEKVDNDYDFDKYVEYFKYIDYAVSRYIQKLVPASLDMLREGLSTVIENFVLGDRNKFRNKPPVIREKIPEFNAQVLGINELTYNWKYGHAPLDDLQKNNCRWWLQRASRKTSVLASGDTQLDADKQEILESNNNETNAPDYTLKDSVTSAQYSGSTYAIRRLAKPYKVLSTLEKPIKGGSNYYPNKNYNFLLDAVRKGDTDSDGIVAYIRGYENAVPYANLPAGLHPFPDCTDSLELAKLGAKKRQWEGMIERDNQTGLDFSIWGYEDKVKIRQWTPFSLYSSSVDLGGVDSTLINNFQTGAIVTNLHDDVYGHDKEVPMQGPFTEKFVGGLQYRHIALNSGSNLDTAETRPEGWSITYLHTGGGSTLLYLGAPYGSTLGSRPTALYYRDETAKRPVNIRNIQQTTASNITHIGNYTKDYEVVLTNGRSTNNVYLTEVGAITASSAETLISGVFDYALPDRTRNDWVIVNRFSAPGGPEVNGLGFLDIEANEYSVYNALPWRNLTVRQPLRSLLSDHSKQFGYFSDAFNSASYVRAGKAYPGTSGSVNTGSYYAKGAYQDATASFQKVNRNRLRMPVSGTGISMGTWSDKSSSYNNAFVQHQIPRTDLQYAWITASLINNYTGSALFQFEQKNMARADYASTDITFCSASDFVSYAFVTPTTQWWGQDKSTLAPAGSTPLSQVFTDFVGLNYNIYETASLSQNSIGWGEILRGDIGGMGLDCASSVWYNYMGKPLCTNGVGAVAANVQFSVASLLNGIILHRQGPYGWPSWKQIRGAQHPIARAQQAHNTIGYIFDNKMPGQVEVIRNFTEPIATSKYKPLRVYMPTSDTEDYVAKTVMTYGNQNVMFTDHSADILNTEGVILDTALVYGKVRPKTYSPYLAMKAIVEKSNTKASTEVLYTEVIYPKEQFTYLSESRRRLRFANDYWRNSRSDRLKANLVNFANVTIQSSSLWKMDAHPEFTTTINYIPFSATMPVRDGTGELQNCYNLFHYSPLSSPSSYITAAPSYVRRIPLIAAYALTASNIDANIIPGYTNATAFSGASEEIRIKALGGAATTVSPFDIGNSGLRKMPLPCRYSASVGDTLWEVTSSAGKDITPFYDSYDDYAEDGVRIMQEGTILPEFRISEKMADYYAMAENKDWRLDFPTKDNFKGLITSDGAAQYALRIQDGLLELTGASYNNLTETDKFLNRYAFSDFYRHFKLIKEDYNDNRAATQLVGDMVEKNARSRTPLLSLGCEALMKLVPYDGFYPAQRSVQLAALFSASYYNPINLSSTGAAGPFAGGEESWRTAMQPFYAPGIFYNTIKSGIAVDYPIHVPSSAEPHRGYPVTSDVWGHCISGSFTQRVNFEQVVNGPTYLRIKDTDPFLDTRLNSTASIKGEQSPLYKFAANNYFSEVTNFFINSASPTALISGKDLPETINIPSSGTYVMDVVLRNSTNIVDAESYCAATASMVPSASSLFVNSSSFIMYSRANTGFAIDSHMYGSSFGPPVKGGYAIYQPLSGLPAHVYRKLASFEPYTPPYYNGYASCRVSVGLEAQSDLLIDEILSNLTMSYDALTTFSTVSSSATEMWFSTAQKCAMQLSASLNFGQGFGSEGYTAGGNWVFTNENDPSKRRLAIHPKFECPVLDFTNTSPTQPYAAEAATVRHADAKLSGSVARGMWHQMGTPPVSGNGLWMEVQNSSFWLNTDDAIGSPHHNPNTEYKSLSYLLGYGKGSGKAKKVGGMPTKRKLSEAIVAIPFKVVGDLNASITETELYKMSPTAVEDVKNSVAPFGNAGIDSKFSSKTSGPIFKDKVPFQAPDGTIFEYTDLIKDYWRDIPPQTPEGADPAIYKLLSLMRKYVIPPHMDFLHNSDVVPFTMYMWEFEVELDEEDIRNMWQNTAPKIAKRAIKATSDVITHVLPTTPIQATDYETSNFSAQHGEGTGSPSTAPGAGASGNPWASSVKQLGDEAAFAGAHPYFLDVFDENKTRWAVFKVKKRGRNNYANIAGRQEIQGESYVRDDVDFPHDFAYSYNWPHDFFSLIELGKITSTVTFNPQAGNPGISQPQLSLGEDVIKVAKVISTLAKLGDDD